MLPFSINTFWSLTQALSTLRKVCVARLTAMLTASSMLWSETALISVTRATVIYAPPFVFPTGLLPLRQDGNPPELQGGAGVLRGSGSSFRLYSLNCREEEFSETQLPLMWVLG